MPLPTPEQRVTANLTIDSFVSEILYRNSSYPSIRWLYNREHDFGKGTCAIIGSGASLVGRGQGAAIDAHGDVIRVNRLPTNRTHWRDVGRRTSVWFSKMCRLKPFRVGHGAALRLLVMDSKLKTGDSEDTPIGYCPLDGPAVRCPFRAFVAMGKKHKKNATDVDKCFGAGMRSLSSRQSSAVRVGIASEARFDAAIAMRHGREASMGLHALLTFAPHCRGGVRLYGFSGNGTTDGHHIGHALTIEHALMAELMRRSEGRIQIVP